MHERANPIAKRGFGERRKPLGDKRSKAGLNNNAYAIVVPTMALPTRGDSNCKEEGLAKRSKVALARLSGICVCANICVHKKSVRMQSLVRLHE